MPTSSVLRIATVLLILSLFCPKQIQSTAVILVVLLGGFGSMIHKYTSLDNISDFSTATLPSGVMECFA